MSGRTLSCETKPACSLTENPADKFFFCPKCFQTERVLMRTVLRFISDNGVNTVDEDYLQRYLEYIMQTAGTVVDHNHMVLGPRHQRKHISADDARVTRLFAGWRFERLGEAANPDRYADLIYYDAMLLCPNCRTEMSYRPAHIRHCEMTTFWGHPQQPGCYLCQSIRPGLGRENALAWCASCYAGCGGELDCGSCIYEFAKKKYGLDDDEISALGEEIIEARELEEIEHDDEEEFEDEPE